MNIEELITIDEPLEPETISQLFPHLSPKEREMLLTIKVIKDTNAVFEDMDIFENAVEVLNGIVPDVESTEGTRPEFVWKALEIMKRLRPDMDLSDEVKEYIKFSYKDNGLIFYPPLAGIDNPKLSEITEKAIEGPFPLSEDLLGIQTLKYLKIQRYLKGE